MARDSCRGYGAYVRAALVAVVITATGVAVLDGSRQAPPPGGTSTQPPVFRSGVQLIEVDVVATDAQGRPEMDLTRDEFALLDEGQRQEIAFFAAVSLPVQRPHPPVLRDVASNAFAEDGRLFVLVLDDIHSLRATTPVIKAAARRLVERLSPQDQVAVLWMSTEKKGAFEFTTNHAAVLAAIDGFAASKASVQRHAGSLFYDPDIELQANAPNAGPRDVSAFFEKFRPFNLVADLCQSVTAIPRRRKAIVYVGRGPVGALLRDRADPNMDDDLYLAVVNAMQAARRANVALYVIDPSAPAKPGAEGYVGEPGPLSFRDLARMRQDTMASFGQATGGLWGTGQRSAELVDRIVTETSQYYLLGYYPPPPTSRAARWLKEAAGNPFARFRSLEVRTTRPGVTVRARKGYWPDDARPEREEPAQPGTVTSRAVTSVLPVSALPLRAVAVPVRGEADAEQHPVAVAIEVTAASPGGQPEHADVFGVAVEAGEKPRATLRASATFGRTAEAGAVSRYLLCERIDLRPGRYQLRLGVTSQWAGATGSVYVDVTVPDFRGGVLSMSGLVLEQRTGGAPMPVARPQRIEGLLAALPTLAREFAASDAVWVTADVYRRAGAPAIPVEVITALGLEGETDAIWHAREVFPPAALGEAGRARLRVPLPLDSLAPGAYRLRVTATLGEPTPRAREHVSVRRELDITIGAPGQGSLRD